MFYCIDVSNNEMVLNLEISYHLLPGKVQRTYYRPRLIFMPLYLHGLVQRL